MKYFERRTQGSYLHKISGVYTDTAQLGPNTLLRGFTDVFLSPEKNYFSSDKHNFYRCKKIHNNKDLCKNQCRACRFDKSTHKYKSLLIFFINFKIDKKVKNFISFQFL